MLESGVRTFKSTSVRVAFPLTVFVDSSFEVELLPRETCGIVGCGER